MVLLLLFIIIIVHNSICFNSGSPLSPSLHIYIYMPLILEATPVYLIDKLKLLFLILENPTKPLFMRWPWPWSVHMCCSLLYFVSRYVFVFSRFFGILYCTYVFDSMCMCTCVCVPSRFAKSSLFWDFIHESDSIFTSYLIINEICVPFFNYYHFFY